MDIEKHISNLKQYIKDDEIIEKDGSDFANFCKGHIDDIQAVLNELEKKDKIIDLMSEQLAGLAIFDIEKDEPLILGDKEEVKQYFKEKVEG